MAQQQVQNGGFGNHHVQGLIIPPDGDPIDWSLALAEEIPDMWDIEEVELDWDYEKYLWTPDQMRGPHYRDCPWYDQFCTNGPDHCVCDRLTTRKIRVMSFGEDQPTVVDMAPCRTPLEDRIHTGRLQRDDFNALQKGVDRHYAMRALKYRRSMARLKHYMNEKKPGLIVTDELVESYVRSTAECCQVTDHACVFGYRPGTALECEWCDRRTEYRFRLCGMARYIRSYLNWLERVDDGTLTVFETADQEKKTKRGARKFDEKKRYYYRTSKNSVSHLPYWDTAKYVDEIPKWSVTTRAEKAFKKALTQRFDKKFAERVDKTVTLDEALQLHFKMEPKLKQKGLGNPTDLRRHMVTPLETLSKKIDYGIERKMPKFTHNRPHSFVGTDNWVQTFQYLVRTYARKVCDGHLALNAFSLTMTRLYKLDRGETKVQEKYKWMQPAGVIAFLAYVQRYGLYEDVDEQHNVLHQIDKDAYYCAIPNEYDASWDVACDGTWRDSQEPIGNMMVGVTRLLWWRLNVVRSATEHFKVPGKVDYHLMAPHNFVPWMWHKYVCHRRMHGVVCPCSRDLGVVEETMMSSSLAGAGAQLLNDERTRGGITTALSEAIGPHFEKFTELIEQAVRTGQDAASDARTTMLKSTAFVEKLDHMMDKINPLVDKLAPAVSNLATRADGFTAWIESVISNLSTFLPSAEKFGGMPNQWWKGVKISDVIVLVDAYIQWAHCKSKAVRSYTILRTLYLLGLLDKVASAAMWAWEQVTKWFCWEETDDAEQPASWHEMLVDCFENMDLKKASWLSGFMVILLCGMRLPMATMRALGSRVMKMLTNMHFVGLGLLGGKRIFEYVHSTLVVCVDWVRVNVFKIPKSTSEDVKEVG